ncbi:hypothetical protein CVN76_00235, partial [Bacillus sp. mrc49]
MLEGILRKYFNGNDAYCMALYFTDERRTSDDWMREDKIIQDVIDIPRVIEKRQLPEDYSLRFAEVEDAHELAKLYGEIFETYPTPMNDAGYIKKVMEEGTIFSVIQYEGSIVSAASAAIFFSNSFIIVFLSDKLSCANVLNGLRIMQVKIIIPIIL